MARKSKKNFKPSFESRGIGFLDRNGSFRKETYTRIYESVKQSRAFYTLSPTQRELLSLCKGQLMGKHKPKQDYKDIDEITDKCFYLTLDQVVLDYHLYGYKDPNNAIPKNHKKEFYRDMEELERHGFIKKVAQGGGVGHKKTVWTLVDKWQTWEE